MTRTLTAALAAAALTACATADSAPTDDFVAAMGVMDSSTERMYDGEWQSTAWISNEFRGTHTRDLDANRLRFTVNNTHPSQGGWDGSVSQGEDDPFGGVRVAEVGEGAVACTSYHIDMDVPAGAKSKYWAGPKVSVNWAAMESDDNPGDWYENYIITAGSDSPQAWLDGMRSWTEVEDLGRTVIDGQSFRHFKMRFQDWWQFWSFRENFNDETSVRIKPILDVWVQHGLPEAFEVDGVKANVETYGPMNAAGQISATFNQGGLRAATGTCEAPAALVAPLRVAP